MEKYKLGINTVGGFGIDELRLMEIIKESGFDAFFNCWEPDKDLAPYVTKAKELGLIYQSVHAPFGGCECIWQPGERGERYIDTLCRCAEDCARYDIPVFIVHPFIGFHDHTPTDIGVERYLRLIDRAERLGVKAAYENVEGDEYLAAIMSAASSPAAGFCLDTGHEVCYNRSKDRLALYGDRLIATHFNDNLGIRTTDGSITPADDLHLLPFDGVVDWQGVMERIRAHGYSGILTFELKVKGGKEHAAYQNMTPEEYYAEAFRRACRVAAL